MRQTPGQAAKKVFLEADLLRICFKAKNEPDEWDELWDRVAKAAIHAVLHQFDVGPERDLSEETEL